MESNALLELIDQLDGHIESLEDVLSPLLEDSLSATTKKLPLLDRAKLNITVVYAIESLLFSYLKINGVDAKEHPVYKELRRVQQYFAKVKEAEESVIKPSLVLNKQAAARMIQHSLAGNGTSDMTQREKELKERILAKRKLKASSTPAPAAISPPAAEIAELVDSISRGVEMQEQEGSEEGEIEETSPQIQHPLPQKPQFDSNLTQPIPNKRKHSQGQSSKLSAERKAEKKARKKAKKARSGIDSTAFG